MITQDTEKVVILTPPAAIVDNAAFTTAALDTRGWRRVTIYLFLGALDIAMVALKLQQSDDSGMAGAVDISGGDFSVSPATLPSATDDNKAFGIHVDMLGKKRYLDLSATGGDGTAGTYATVVAVLSRPEQSPTTAAGRGLSQELFC